MVRSVSPPSEVTLSQVRAQCVPLGQVTAVLSDVDLWSVLCPVKRPLVRFRAQCVPGSVPSDVPLVKVRAQGSTPGRLRARELPWSEFVPVTYPWEDFLPVDVPWSGDGPLVRSVPSDVPLDRFPGSDVPGVRFRAPVTYPGQVPCPVTYPWSGSVPSDVPLVRDAYARNSGPLSMGLYVTMILKYSERSGIRRLLRLDGFADLSTKETWDLSAWIRTYSVYLDERLEVFKAFRFDTENTSESKLKDCRTEALLERLPLLLARLIACVPQGTAANNVIVIQACEMVLKEMRPTYKAVCDGILNLADQFFDMERGDALRGLELYKDNAALNERITEYFAAINAIGALRGSALPPDFLTTLEDYVKEAPKGADPIAATSTAAPPDHASHTSNGAGSVASALPPAIQAPIQGVLKIGGPITSTPAAPERDLLGDDFRAMALAPAQAAPQYAPPPAPAPAPPQPRGFDDHATFNPFNTSSPAPAPAPAPTQARGFDDHASFNPFNNMAPAPTPAPVPFDPFGHTAPPPNAAPAPTHTQARGFDNHATFNPFNTSAPAPAPAQAPSSHLAPLPLDLFGPVPPAQHQTAPPPALAPHPPASNNPFGAPAAFTPPAQSNNPFSSNPFASAPTAAPAPLPPAAGGWGSPTPPPAKHNDPLHDLTFDLLGGRPSPPTMQSLKDMKQANTTPQLL
eukprot:gene11871-14975_t